MRWVRTNLRLGSWCALLAVMIQLAVSFGHAHFDPLRLNGLFAQGSQGPAAADRQAPGDPVAPASKPVGLAFEYCAICAVINIGASMVPQAAPSSVVPIMATRVRYVAHADASDWAQAHLPFRARAPPSV